MRLTSVGLVAAALLAGCVDSTEADRNGRYLVDLPPGWINTPEGGGEWDPDEDAEETRAVLLPDRSTFSQSTVASSSLSVSIKHQGSLAISDAEGSGGLHARGHLALGKQPFHVSSVDSTVYAWIFEAPAFGASSQLHTIDISDPGAPQRIDALEIPGTIQYVHSSAGSMVAVTVDDDRDAHSSTWVHRIDLSDPNAPALIDSMELSVESPDGEFGVRDFHRAGTRLYVSTPVYGSSASEVSTHVDVLALGDGLAPMELEGSLDFDAWIPRGGIDASQADVLRVLLRDEENGTTELATFAGSDMSPAGRIELGSGDLLAFIFDGNEIHVQHGADVSTTTAGPSGVELLPTSVRLPGDNGRLTPVGDDELFFIESIENPGGGFRTGISRVDLSAQSVGPRFEFLGDHVREGTVERVAGRYAIPIQRTWFEPDGECSDASNEYGVALLALADDALEQVGFVRTEAAVESVEQHEGMLLVHLADQDLVFDISDPSAVRQVSSAVTAVSAEHLVLTDASAVRVNTDRFGEQILDVTPRDSAVPTASVARVALPSPSLQDLDPCGSVSHWTDDVLAHGDHVFVSRHLIDAGPADGYRSIAIVDVSDPSDPRFVRELSLPTHHNGRDFDISSPSSDVLIVDDRLVVATYGSPEYEEREDGGLTPMAEARITIFDLADPAAPEEIASFERLEAIAHGPMLLSNRRVITWAAAPANADATHAHVFAEMFHVAGDPEQLAPVSIPGVPLAYDLDGELLVADLRVSGDGLSRGLCEGNGYTWSGGACDGQRADLAKLQLLPDSAELTDEIALPSDPSDAIFTISPERVFAVHGGATGPAMVSAIDWTADEPRVGTVDLPADTLGSWRAHPRDTRAVVTWIGGYGVLDALDADSPTLEPSDRLPFGCSDAVFSGEEQAVCVGGRWGLELLSM